MSKELNQKRIKDADTLFENKSTKIVAQRNSPMIELVGLKIGPFEEGNEYEVKLWVAQQLEKAGLVRCREETLTASRLYPILHRERIQPVGSLSSLPEDFYPRLRRVLVDTKIKSKSSPEKMREYEYVEQLSKDIVSYRFKKIISLASSESQKSQQVRNLTVEEIALYEDLDKTISGWRNQIL